MSAPKHSRFKAVAVLVLVFLLGAGCGIGGGLFVLRGIVHRTVTAKQNQRAPVDFFMARLERDIARDLELNEAQRRQLHEDLQSTSVELKELRAETWQKARAVTRESLDRIAGRLPPEKAEKLRGRASDRLRYWGLVD